MKKTFRIFTVVALVAMLACQSAWAGNDNRRGTAGATELLVNPWARSTGWGSVSVANVRGLESFYSNIAGLCFLQGVGFNYSNTFLYGGKSGLSSGGNINALALGVRVSEQGVLGISLNSFSFGDIPITREGSPEPNNGTFSPTLMNINVAYAHSFTTSIHGGVNIKVINETTDNITGTGFSVDAGIQYVTGADEELKFGISLKNWGPSMKFTGTGHSFTFINEAGNTMTAEYRAGEMELPTCLNIGISYDFLFEAWQQRLTIAGAFTSNAFLKDNITLGLEYSMFNIFSIRCGYVWQQNIFSENERTTANTGFCAGGSVDIPLAKKDSESNLGLSIDYSYRMAAPLKGTHSIGASFRF